MKKPLLVVAGRGSKQNPRRYLAVKSGKLGDIYMITQNPALWASEAKKFFQTLFHQLDTEERIEIRYKLPGADQVMNRKFFQDLSKATDHALKLRQSHEVYVGVAPRQGNVGTKEGVTRLHSIWGDLDIKDHHTSAHRFEQLDGLTCSPSMLVWSGGGYHPYWLLAEAIEGSHELIRAQQTMARIADGLDVDAVYDRSRILRVPGTLNHKYDESCPVRLLHCNPEQRYTLDQLQQMAESLPRQKEDKGTGGKIRNGASGKAKSNALSKPICEGQRNTVLTSVAGSLRDRGLDEETMKVVLLEVNILRCEPPLSDDEVERIARSVCKYSAGSPRYRRSSVKRIYPHREVR